MEKYVVFTCHQQKFALPIDKTEKILQLEKVTSVLDATAYILGIIQYDEQILPVIDMNERFFKERMAFTSDAKIIVAEWHDKRIGLAVDDVLTVQTFESVSLKEHHDKIKDETAESIRAFISKDEEIITLLNCETFISETGSKELEELIEKAG
ncbi:chemotaxis protein CheW [Pisciglobus halotolerans]|uniref:Purine-binding chemotaxis protein CheW n=1 Tax=Pisciglobus halotolerans TaxID=745365 RepID=A0A1I3APV7_9LACT|nr:chemotaxis protein CheW [Pisciglobus halotolerans]SFH51759.1 purine-binding chemotaxis protein CheW [Pisciglobus halotolerans]